MKAIYGGEIHPKPQPTTPLVKDTENKDELSAMAKLKFPLILLSILLGVWFGAFPYWPDISAHSVSPTYTGTWEAGEIDNEILKNTPNIEQLLTVQPPSVDASTQAWTTFLNSLNSIKLGERFGNYGSTSPLLVWYAYVAKHHPASIYQAINGGNFDTTKLNHLLMMGFLQDWDTQVKDRGQLLLANDQALLRFALSEGEQVARRTTMDAFFNVANDPNNAKPRNINLENLRFAMGAMTEEEKIRAIKALGDSRFKFDPRDVRHLLLVPGLDREELLPLIQQTAYSSKSMSSYMTTGALLGDIQYVHTLVNDVRDNASQPTNFYCSACALALATEGLIGQPLYEAIEQQRLLVNLEKEPPFILSLKTNSNTN